MKNTENNDLEPVAVGSIDVFGKDEIRQLSSLFFKLIDKDWFQEWSLLDVCCLIRRARHWPECDTCKGDGLGCKDCAETGLYFKPN